ncbi:hypothetical protein ABW21_db0209043 [Orbilia brochopaga]|nr:hypothetical protein ABW21_db0209043 [Drechslerella brochopaga]
MQDMPPSMLLGWRDQQRWTIEDITRIPGFSVTWPQVSQTANRGYRRDKKDNRTNKHAQEESEADDAILNRCNRAPQSCSNRAAEQAWQACLRRWRVVHLGLSPSAFTT